MRILDDYWAGGGNGSNPPPANVVSAAPAAPSPNPGPVFFATQPEPDTVPQIARLTQHLAAESRLTGKPIAPERLHVTLFHLGDVPGLAPSFVGKACAVAAGIRMRPFDVVFDRVTQFPRRQGASPVVVLGDDGVTGLLLLQKALVAALKNAGLVLRRLLPFTPHMTLLYDHAPVADPAARRADRLDRPRLRADPQPFWQEPARADRRVAAAGGPHIARVGGWATVGLAAAASRTA